MLIKLNKDHCQTKLSGFHTPVHFGWHIWLILKQFAFAGVSVSDVSLYFKANTTVSEKHSVKFQRFESNKYGDKTNEPRRNVDELFIFAILHNSNGWICIVLFNTVIL